MLFPCKRRCSNFCQSRISENWSPSLASFMSALVASWQIRLSLKNILTGEKYLCRLCDLKNMENENEKDATVKAWMMDNGSPTSGDLHHQGLHFLHCEFLCSSLNVLYICLCQMPLAIRPSVGILSSYSFAFKMITCWANGAHRHDLLFCPLLDETVWQFCLISGKFGANDLLECAHMSHVSCHYIHDEFVHFYS